MTDRKVSIIGAGIAGMTAAIYLKRAGIPFLLFEAGMPGGKLALIRKLENFPGRKAGDGSDLALDLLAQLTSLGIDITYEVVRNVTKKEDGTFTVTTDAGEHAGLAAVIVASGTADPAMLIKGEKTFFGRGVSTCPTCDGAFYLDQDIAVIGHGDHLIEEILPLLAIARTIHVVIDGDVPLKQASLDSLKNSKSKIVIYKDARPEEIKGDAKVRSLILKTKDGMKELFVSGVFLLREKESATAFLKGSKPEERNGYLIVDKNMMTSVPGLFAAGDVIDRRIRQLVIAASDGALAALSLLDYLRH